MVLTLLIGMAIGAAIGALLGLLVKARDRAWAFIRTPGRGALLGAVVGLMFAYYFGAPVGWRPEGQSRVVPLTAETFDATIAGEAPVVAVFYTQGCPACRRLAPKVEKLADEYDGRVVVAKVDVAKEEALADRYEVHVVPTVVYFVGGEPTGPAETAPSSHALHKRAKELIAKHAATPRPEAEEPPLREVPAPEEAGPEPS